MKVQMKYITGYLLAFVFAGYFSSVTCFSHTHVVNGRAVVHSHFHFGGTEHTHTENAIATIFQISHVIVITPAPLVVANVLRTIVDTILVKEITLLKTGFTPFASLRAPPQSCC
ncbi:hypothetical protein FACS189467_1290 [Bacteroidia bacterium]|nr:hypothetical protein FACS189467_1290 [Bacteroidia bacterium]